ncbi:MAG: NADH:flavin oxidoreductase [Anaerolineae bacterium]|nr:NADH:flavin oxidoreductase [Anaerolineae bacterium]
MPDYPRIAALRTPEAFAARLRALGLDLGFDAEMVSGAEAPLAQPYTLRDGTGIGNRFCVLAMEGWDGTQEGRPTELTERRWRNFGLSGSKLIWGGEATAVQPDGRANPNQLMITPATVGDLAALRRTLVDAHRERFGATDDLLVGLQLTHSGRFCKPTSWTRLEPRIAYHHPLLDAKFGIAADTPPISDDYIRRLIERFVVAAKLAQQAGFAFVDVKHCHGYLGHELLSARTRPGPYGGSFENRTRYLREIVDGIRTEVPGLGIGVRVSAFDFVPFQPGPDGIGVPTPFAGETYDYAFGGDGTGTGIDLTEPFAFVDLLAELGIELVCVTGGSPYYVPHIQRPALFPPSDGYGPPEDPLAGVARQVWVTAQLKQHRPDLCFVGSAYSYLQEWLPNVAQAIVRTGQADFVGLGRMVLPYPDIAADALDGRTLDRRRICRTFSDCTTAPRSALPSGCYPLDDFYKQRPEKARLDEAKRKLKGA